MNQLIAAQAIRNNKTDVVVLVCVQSVRGMLENPTEAVSELSYFDCIDSVMENSKVELALLPSSSLLSHLIFFFITNLPFLYFFAKESIPLLTKQFSYLQSTKVYCGSFLLTVC